MSDSLSNSENTMRVWIESPNADLEIGKKCETGQNDASDCENGVVPVTERDPLLSDEICEIVVKKDDNVKTEITTVNENNNEDDKARLKVGYKKKEKKSSGTRQFTVIKVKEADLNTTSSSRPVKTRHRSADLETVKEHSEFTPTNTLTSHTLTALLSAKWQDISRKIKDYGEKTRFRKRIVSKWESLNYDTVENELYWHDIEKPKIKRAIAYRWLIALFTGIFTAILAAVIHMIVETLGHFKFEFLKKHLDRCARDGCMYQPALMWIGINVAVSCLGSVLIVYYQPMAFGGGVPFIKSYLNGVKIPGLLTLECFIAKVVGVIMSILGGLACGKEGPMAHSGSIIAAGLGKGRVRCICSKKRISVYEGFRDDHEIRDFVSGGAAAGVSAAFGTPVGGTLFSLEEAASFWSNSLTWRVFFSAMVGCFCTNVLLSMFHGTPLQLSEPGLVRFDVHPNLHFELTELPVFLIMGAVGGLLGAAFVVINYKLTVFRNRYIKIKWLRVAEVGLVAALAGLFTVVMFSHLDSCTDENPYYNGSIVAKIHCPENTHHSLSTLFLATPEGCFKALMNDPYGTFGPVTLAGFAILFYFLAVLTYGLHVSRGIFVPSLVIGAAWGRLFGIAVVHIFPGNKEHLEASIGKYALIGAASQLGGVLRATISLSVMIIECTGEVSFGLPIILVLMISKWVGDFITTGLYDMNIEVLGLPLLPWDAPALCDTVKTSDLMNTPALTLNKVERIGRIVEILRNETFCGFPVIDSTYKENRRQAKICGLILRSQLLILLKQKVFCPENGVQPTTIRSKDFRKYYYQYLKIKDINISEEEMDNTMDLRPYFSPNPYTIGPTFSLPRLFRLFRGLGLRHLVVVNDNKEPIGMITRKDLAKFRVESKRGLVKVEQLNIEDK